MVEKKTNTKSTTTKKGFISDKGVFDSFSKG